MEMNLFFLLSYSKVKYNHIIRSAKSKQMVCSNEVISGDLVKGLFTEVGAMIRETARGPAA